VAAATRATRLSQANTIIATDVIVDSTSIDVSFEKSSSTTPQYTSASSNVEVILDDDFQSTVSEVVVDDSDYFDNDVDDDGNDTFRTIVDASDEEKTKSQTCWHWRLYTLTRRRVFGGTNDGSILRPDDVKF
jgi:hypothetical protein